MSKLNSLLKVIFYLCNVILILFYLYPASLFGYILYGDSTQQPQITVDFLKISSNHFYSFFLLSLLGILSHLNDKKINFLIIYLFLLSIILEMLHLIIPNRAFEASDLFGNILGTIVIFIIYKIWKKI